MLEPWNSYSYIAVVDSFSGPEGFFGAEKNQPFVTSAPNYFVDPEKESTTLKWPLSFS
jgi:hypothetical protein